MVKLFTVCYVINIDKGDTVAVKSWGITELIQLPTFIAQNIITLFKARNTYIQRRAQFNRTNFKV